MSRTKLPDGIARDELLNWVEKLHIHLNRYSQWIGIENVFQMVRAESDPLSQERMARIIEKADSDPLCRFSNSRFGDGLVRDNDLYCYVYTRLNSELSDLTHDTKSGFDVYRRILREMDPTSEATEHNLKQALSNLVYHFGKSKASRSLCL